MRDRRRRATVTGNNWRRHHREPTRLDAVAGGLTAPLGFSAKGLAFRIWYQ
jgi:hypothetical protein